MTPKTIICDTEHVVAIEQDLGSESVVVTFNEFAFIRDDLRFWGDTFLLKQGLSAIGIVTPRPNWYPRRAMEQVIAAILKRVRGRRVVTYGFSQGGYGALKYSARLNASVALAFSPQWSINPADVASFDSRYTSYFDETLSNGLGIEQEDVCSCAFVFFDKLQKADSANVAKLARLAGIKTIVAPFSRHGTVRIVTEGRTAARLISLCTRLVPPVTDLRQIIRESRRKSHTYSNQMAQQLILRMSQSRHRSSAFVSGLLAKTNDFNPFYAALISHAKGNANVALSELAKVKPKHFKNNELIRCLQLARKLHFDKAEVAVAVQIRRTHPDHTTACLHAVDTMIRVGESEAAYREVTRLTKNVKAADHIGRFVEYSLKLRKPDVIEAFISDALPYSMHVSILFRAVDFYQRFGDRPKAFRKLMQLAKICADSPVDLKRVASSLIELREFAFALELRERLLRNDPGNFFLALDFIEIKARTIRLGKTSGPSEVDSVNCELEKILQTPSLPSVAWEQASQIYEYMGNIPAALEAIRKAIELPDSKFASRHRLVLLLVRKGLVRDARRALAALLAECTKKPDRLRMLGNLAFDLRDPELAQKFADSQFQCDPTNPESILYLARQLRRRGDRIRAQSLLISLFRAERRSAFMSDRQWFRLAQELHEVGEGNLTKEAVAEASARDPNNKDVRKLAATIELVNKFQTAAQRTVARHDASKGGRRTFGSLLAKMFRR